MYTVLIEKPDGLLTEHAKTMPEVLTVIAGVPEYRMVKVVKTEEQDAEKQGDS